MYNIFPGARERMYNIASRLLVDYNRRLNIFDEISLIISNIEYL